jgi:hypothetical protein
MTNTPTQITNEMVLEFLGLTQCESIVSLTDRWERFKSVHYASSSGGDLEILRCYKGDQNITHAFIPESNEDRISNCIIDKCSIHSVRRTSDGVVFSIGDQIESVSKFVGVFGKITGFQLMSNNIMGIKTFSQGLVQLSEIRKAPIPSPRPETKPPIGIMPEWLWREKRLKELREAIKRYCDAKIPVGLDWIIEELLLREWLENHKEDINKKTP